MTKNCKNVKVIDTNSSDLVEGLIITDELEIANAFAANFKSIYSQKHHFNNYVVCLKEPIITKTDIMKEILNIDLNKW